MKDCKWKVVERAGACRICNVSTFGEDDQGRICGICYHADSPYFFGCQAPHRSMEVPAQGEISAVESVGGVAQAPGDSVESDEVSRVSLEEASRGGTEDENQQQNGDDRKQDGVDSSGHTPEDSTLGGVVGKDTAVTVSSC